MQKRTKITAGIAIILMLIIVVLMQKEPPTQKNKVILSVNKVNKVANLPKECNVNYESPKAIAKSVQSVTIKPKPVTIGKLKPKTTYKKSRGGNPYSSGHIKMTTEERYWLEKLVEAESADEPYEGKVAVCTTIANRYFDKNYPKTIMGVIKQKKQYSPWYDGSIYNRVPSKDTKKAVAQVFDKGKTNLPKNVIYFYDPRYAPNNWIERTRKYFTQIGNHIFHCKEAK